MAVAILVVLFGATLFLLQGTGKSGSPSSCLTPPVPCKFNIVGEIIVNPQSRGSGSLNLSIGNMLDDNIVDVSLANVSPVLRSLTNTVPFSFMGNVVSSSEPLHTGDYAKADYTFTSGGSVSTTYTVIVTVTTSRGQTITESTQISAVSH